MLGGKLGGMLGGMLGEKLGGKLGGISTGRAVLADILRPTAGAVPADSPQPWTARIAGPRSCARSVS